MGLLDVIKTAGVQAVDAASPVSVLYGEVVAVNPLSVNVDQRFTLTADFLVVPERLTRYEVNLAHIHEYLDDNGNGNISRNTNKALSMLVIRSGLSIRDKVLLIRMQGGQKYIVLDKVVSG